MLQLCLPPAESWGQLHLFTPAWERALGMHFCTRWLRAKTQAAISNPLPYFLIAETGEVSETTQPAVAAANFFFFFPLSSVETCNTILWGILSWEKLNGALFGSPLQQSGSETGAGF